MRGYMKQKHIKYVKKAFDLLRHHPSAFWTRAKANVLLPILPHKKGEVLVNGIRFRIDPSLAPMTKEMCYGYYENELTSLLTKYIRKGDVCVDVGANIGYISAFMLGLVGKKGAVHSFEPVPEYFERLKAVQEDNAGMTIALNNVALGDFEGTAKISVTNRDNIGWNTLVPNFMSKATIKEEIDIPVKRLDDYLNAKHIDAVRLIKIDTEGYELPVLKGLKNYLDKCSYLPILIVEVAPNAYPKLGKSPAELSGYLEEYGYRGQDILTGKYVDLKSLTMTSNLLFLHPDFH